MQVEPQEFKKKSLKFIIIVPILFMLGIYPIFSQEQEILHLKKSDFDSFVKDHKDWEPFYQERELDSWNY